MKNKILVTLLMSFLLVDCGPDGKYTYSEAESYIMYESEVNFESSTTIKSLDVDWLAGEVHIEEGTYFAIQEEVMNNGNYYPLYYRVQDERLTLKFVKSGTNQADLANSGKKLTVTVPSSFEELNLNIAAGLLTVQAANINRINLQSAAGINNVELNNNESFKASVAAGSLYLKTENAKDVSFDVSAGNGEFHTRTVENVTSNISAGALKLTILDSSKINTITCSLSIGNATMDYDGVRGYYLSKNGKISTVEGSDQSKEKFHINSSITLGDIHINSLS